MASSGEGGPRLRRRRGLLRVGVAGSLTALLLLLSELVLLPATFLNVPRDQYLLGFVAEGPQLDGTPISALGYTGDVPSTTRAAGTTRLLTLGGSVLFNRQMTQRLKTGLSEVFPDGLEVVGAALRQHTSRASVYKYEHLARHGFDYVLIYHGINDLWANHVPRERFRDDYSHLWKSYGGAWYRRGPFVDRSVICRLLYNRFVYREAPVETAGAGFESARALRQNLERIVEAVRRDGGTPVLMTFAWCIPPGYTREAFRARELGFADPDTPCPVEMWGEPAWVAEGLRRHNAAVRALAEEQGVLLVDMERELGKEPSTFSDVCHLSDEGAGRFVGQVARALRDQRPRD